MPELIARYGARAVSLNKTLGTDHCQSLLTILLLLRSFAIAAADYQPHFADVNGDAVADLLLQAATPSGQHILVYGSAGPDGVQHLSSKQQLLPVQAAGHSWCADQAQINGDQVAFSIIGGSSRLTSAKC